MRDKPQKNRNKTDQTNNNKKTSREKITNEKANVNWTGMCIILFGLLVMAILVGINVNMEENTKLWSFTYSFFLNLAIATVTVGAGTVLYSYFDFVNYICTNLRNIILEYKFIKNLNDEQKEDLLNKLSKDLIYNDENSHNDTLYCFVNNEVKELTKSMYYEQLHFNVYCWCSQGKLFKKVVRL